MIQKRMANKDIEGAKWDLSCAEHLQPGEECVRSVVCVGLFSFVIRFLDAAVRGLEEELGIDANSSRSALQVMLEPHTQLFEYPEKNVVDFEMVQTFRLTYDGDIVVDNVEVERATYNSVGQLLDRVRETPEQFTRWFRRELELLGSKVHLIPQQGDSTPATTA